jgi:simple sugar transport system permease protein
MIKIVKKSEVTGAKATVIRLIAVLGAIVCVSAVVLFTGNNPFEVFWKLIEGSVMTQHRLVETLKKAIPLSILALGISFAFKMKFWNIGAEGQFYMGAFGAALVALNAGNMPSVLVLPVMVIAAMITGGLWAMISAMLKVRLGTNETLVTLMLNYVAVKWISYLQYGPWKDPSYQGFAKIARFSTNAQLPMVFGVHIGWIIALVLAALVYFLMNHTKLGYEIEVLGENMNTARYAGIDTKKVLYIAVILSGALCGIAGMTQAAGVERTLTDQMSGGMGFTAVIVSWLAGLSAPVILIVSVLFSMLLKGGDYLHAQMQIPASVAEILQGIILFFVLASEFFIQYKFVLTRRKDRITDAAKSGGMGN